MSYLWEATNSGGSKRSFEGLPAVVHDKWLDELHGRSFQLIPTMCTS